MDASDVTKTHPYSCNSCAVAFRTSDAQRTHMRTDWHRYNLKRKVADLPPVSSIDYNEKVLAAQATTKAVEEQAQFSKACEVCGKTYFSLGAFQSHLGSQRHKLRATARSRTGSVTSTSVTPAESLTPYETRDAEAEAEFDKVVKGIKNTTIREPDPLSRRPSAPPPDAVGVPEHPLSPEKPVIASVPLSRCLFCNYDSPSLKLGVVHMMKIHGLFIPEKDYLVDPEGLMAYMQAKVRQNNECLSCHKLKNTTEGIQTHMRDKGHCKIAFETEEEMLEVGQFYDFSSTYSDPESDSDEEMSDVKAGGGVRVGGGEDEGWETDSSFSSLDSNELTSVPNDDRSESYSRLSRHRHHSNSGLRPHKNSDGFHSHAHSHANAVFYDEHEMHLPSGRVAGHRSLKKYFRQNLHNYPTTAERAARAQRLLENMDEEDEDAADSDNVAESTPHSQTLLRRGEAGMLGVSDTQRKEVRAQEQKSRTSAQRSQNRYQAKLERQNNFQKHFRDPLLQ